MRVVHLLWGLQVGGMENLLVDIVNRQATQSTIHVIVINDLVNEELLARIDSRCTLHLLKRKVGSRNPWPIVRMNLLLRRINPDIIHYHAAEIVRYVCGKWRSIATVHNTHLPTAGYSKQDALVAISEAVHKDISEAMNRETAEAGCQKSTSKAISKEVQATSKEVQNCVAEETQGCPVYIIENGIDFASVCKRDAGKALSFDGDFRLVQVSRLYHPQKGQDILLRAMALLKAEGLERISLDLIGEGESRQYLSELAQELQVKVSFLGNKDRAYVYAHLQDYDLFVQPSRYEGFGLTVIEAIAAHLPVLVSDIEGPMEIIADGKYGFSFRTEDVAHCARQIRHLLEHPPTHHFLNEAHAHASSCYSIATMVDKYTKLYHSVLK